MNSSFPAAVRTPRSSAYRKSPSMATATKTSPATVSNADTLALVLSISPLAVIWSNKGALAWYSLQDDRLTVGTCYSSPRSRCSPHPARADRAAAHPPPTPRRPPEEVHPLEDTKTCDTDPRADTTAVHSSCSRRSDSQPGDGEPADCSRPAKSPEAKAGGAHHSPGPSAATCLSR